MRSEDTDNKWLHGCDSSWASTRTPSPNVRLHSSGCAGFFTPHRPPNVQCPPSASCASKSETGRQRMWSLEDFDIGRKLGEGRFGKIYLARERQTKCAVVLKCISKEMIRFHGLAHQLRREIELQEYAGRYHKHILRLFAYFWDEERIFLVLEYADGGNLETLLDSRPQHRLSEMETRAVLRPLLSAFIFLHERDIIHRDVKPDNILFKSQELKLADFSWAVRLNPRDPKHSRRHTICGTMDYLSPEHIARRGCTTKADVWALGVLTYRMLCGCLPFEHASPREVCARIVAGSVQYPMTLSAEARAFIEALLCVDESARLTCREALDHPFMQQMDTTADDLDTLSIPRSSETSATQAPFLSFSTQAPLPVHPIVAKDPPFWQQQERKEQTKPMREERKPNPPQIHRIGGNSITKGLSASWGSFISVSSSHSSERAPVASGSFVNVSSLSSSALRWECPTSKSGIEEFGGSSHGASYSRPRMYSSKSTSSGATNMSTQHNIQFDPSMIAVLPLEKRDILMDEGDETNCAVRLHFDESLASLSQLTTDASPMVVNPPEHEVLEVTMNNSEQSLDPLSISAISHA